jgi:hypothetical protein
VAEWSAHSRVVHLPGRRHLCVMYSLFSLSYDELTFLSSLSPRSNRQGGRTRNRFVRCSLPTLLPYLTSSAHSARRRETSRCVSLFFLHGTRLTLSTAALPVGFRPHRLRWSRYHHESYPRSSNARNSRRVRLKVRPLFSLAFLTLLTASPHRFQHIFGGDGLLSNCAAYTQGISLDSVVEEVPAMRQSSFPLSFSSDYITEIPLARRSGHER